MIDREVERLRGLRATALRIRAVARALGEATRARQDGTSPADDTARDDGTSPSDGTALVDVTSPADGTALIDVTSPADGTALIDVTSPADDTALVDGLLDRGRCAAWRLARTVSGHLRGHPYASFQKDAGLAVVLSNSLTAAGAAWGVKTRRQALVRFDAELRALFRQLCDVRALTRIAGLDESLGRSQIELRALLAALAHETGARKTGAHETIKVASRAIPDAPATPADLMSHRAARAAAASPRPLVARAALESNWPYLAF